MSFTRLVPTAVPSDFHSSRPVVPSSATRNRVPLTFVSSPGTERRGPGGGPVGLPQLAAGGAVVGGEEQGPPHVREPEGGGADGPRVDVLHSLGPGGGPVGLPQLEAGGAVVGGEEQGPPHVREPAGAGAVGPRADVLHW